MRYLFLSSWTGGGHMAVANAVSAALHELDPAACISIEDALRSSKVFPFTKFPDAYGPLVTYLPSVWSALYDVCDSEPRADVLTSAGWPLVSGYLQRLVHSVRPDVIIPVHPLFVRPAVRLARKAGYPKVACIVTDLVRLHSFWLDPRADLYIVPSAEAEAAVRLAGVPPDRIILSGQPITASPPLDTTKEQAKAQLGFDVRRPLIVVTGGGPGLGPIEPVALALSRALRHETQIGVICGHNEGLRNRLSKYPQLDRVTGYVNDMPIWLRAADVFVTKAGPSALAEAMAEGVPTVVMSALPGQERDNMEYYQVRRAAIWAPTSELVVSAVKTVLRDPDAAAALSRNAKAASQPGAAMMAAERIVDLVRTAPMHPLGSAFVRTT